MRVIAGTARSLPLKTPVGNGTRPTTDRIKETLFNMIWQEMPECRFLDLFSGSGGIGIEALSRGAEFAMFLEQNRNAVKCIEENLAFTKFTTHSKVLCCDVLNGLCRLSQEAPFHIVFMDPPYDCDLEKQVLEILSDSKIINRDSIIIVEASLKTDFSYLSDYGFHILKEKKYKTNKHMFLMLDKDEK